MAGKGLDAFRKNLLETEGLVLDDWKFSKGCIPVQKSLFKDGVVLAGTISGMIDPFYLNGISGALISGKIAALFFMDQKRALKQFSWFTRNFRLKRFLKSIADRLPIKAYSAPAICMLNNRFRWVGVI
jgi:flavin-dependent dehydrogenase